MMVLMGGGGGGGSSLASFLLDYVICMGGLLFIMDKESHIHTRSTQLTKKSCTGKYFSPDGSVPLEFPPAWWPVSWFSGYILTHRRKCRLVA